MNLIKRPEFFLALWMALVSPTWAAPTPIDYVVAVVNDEVITRLELTRRYDEIVQGLAQKNTPLPPRPVLEKQLLDEVRT